MAEPKILIVDDDPDYVESTKIILEGDGYEVIVAYDGDEGLQKAKEERPDLVIIDLMMRTMNEGFDLCRNIRQDNAFDGIPLVMISAAHQFEEYKNAQFAPDDIWFPIDKFLDKPVDKNELLTHVARFLKK